MPASDSLDKHGTSRDPRSGALFVEFALVLPIFLLILLGIMEFASLLFVRTVMLSSARNAVRAYSIGSLDASQAEQFAVDQLSGFGLSFSAVATPQADSGTDRSVQLSTPSGPATLGDPLGLFSGQDVVVQATMRREE